MSAAIEMYALTDVGMKRDHNEDAVGITPEMGVAVLADGMGGHNAGEVASAMAVDIISRYLKDRLKDLPEAKMDENTGFNGESILAEEVIDIANSAIFETANKNQECAGMGTTVVTAIFYQEYITAIHVGDSRMYRLRDETLTHVTQDHSLIQEQVRRGLLTEEDARNSSIKNLVTKALGIEARVEPDVVEDIFQPGDYYMICSDGLTDVVPDEAIRQTIIEKASDLKQTCEALIQLANDAGGPDNISIIMIYTKKKFNRKKGFFARLFGQ
ncbi:MAG: protein phosphatase [Zetaproteobacteria bacterium CG_4_9_14_3_um_filter_49_83]|nr:MAG: protein phosphatase [Zetaproteobacteria bacterium CG1_02_49_23]PIQ33963.1 MAG: protein phosphatase [Zetaproteobacteria bacterium CG17_big_fil_post_rev_8_21_14_2_50_50_13]PIV30388.1 MAG: protein phosphatase [Zetaproteobacteria bacterium CG02_land_8_20_14_3_00_50_9]PIY56744.1 MAG: protein phosphatase [Zetaproteobacteria bacterium CG_4_10_14_0_8_um_filter_49_80]PJA35964.1 MAG: protein phosphatase [Zetaproteobacteria bacterium CG_4_9_14_3_um_filter_49_83]